MSEWQVCPFVISSAPLLLPTKMTVVLSKYFRYSAGLWHWTEKWVASCWLATGKSWLVHDKCETQHVCDDTSGYSWERLAVPMMSNWGIALRLPSLRPMTTGWPHGQTILGWRISPGIHCTGWYPQIIRLFCDLSRASTLCRPAMILSAVQCLSCSV